jgi:hypothetical protein
MRAFLAALLLWLAFNSAVAQSIGGVDCATIRKLTAIERWYWIKRLGLSAADIRAIKKQCGIR